MWSLSDGVRDFVLRLDQISSFSLCSRAHMERKFNTITVQEYVSEGI